jgi:hypothetical protein
MYSTKQTFIRNTGEALTDLCTLNMNLDFPLNMGLTLLMNNVLVFILFFL